MFIACTHSSKKILRRNQSIQMQKLMSDALNLGKCKAAAMLESLAQVLSIGVISHPTKKGRSSLCLTQPTKECKPLETLSCSLKVMWHRAVHLSQIMNYQNGLDVFGAFTSASALSTACKLQLLSLLSTYFVPGLYPPLKSCSQKVAEHSANSIKPRIEQAVRLRPAWVKEPSASALASAQVVAGTSVIGWSGFIRPVDKVWEVSSNFGPRWGRQHNGVDLAAPSGEPVLAADAGEVTFAGWESGGYGYLVEITHWDGWKTLYAHNSEVFTWKGDFVHRGQCIASVGETGRATGPHLHWEIRNHHGSPVNPAHYVDL
ncbi:hypothetical protein O6H91_14G061900 [Diphasiastrum complanatum]|uniref:Uncharacterized protein n=1 Tax=Diphasiastrum complanatum TaxID=34168 RepID=A0ACC2BQB4_DIPCM|nr:hypothetical protein O6H91_14G061900 [Diphasiastrum complanatum]